MATTTSPSPTLSLDLNDAALQAAVRPLRHAHLRAVVDAARCVAQNSAMPGATAFARRVLAAIQAVHGAAALRS